jgi:hypothetical protein
LAAGLDELAGGGARVPVACRGAAEAEDEEEGHRCEQRCDKVLEGHDRGADVLEALEDE